ncbi:MAG: DUF2231 domain-containing protein [Nocardioides sp.]
MSLLAATAQRIGQVRGLDAAAEWAQSYAEVLTESPQLDAVLGGDWLGHPVHPVASQLPIGAWTMGTLLDVADGERYAGAVDLLTLVGVVAALPTVATGAHDWVSTTGPARRVGLVHALTMDTTLALFVAATVVRRRGDRVKGRKLALAGAATAAAGGFLGGHLAFALGVGRRR